MNSRFSPHKIEWTPEKIERFWDACASGADERYFSSKYGDSLIRTAKHYVKLDGRILDFGCGPGFLLEKLIGRKILVPEHPQLTGAVGAALYAINQEKEI